MSSSQSSSTRVFNALIVENLTVWQEILSGLIQESFPGAKIHIADDYDKAREALVSGESWDLITLDIGLPPAPDSQKLGMLLAQQAGQKRLPYLVVSDTIKTPSTDTTTLLKKYRAHSFVSKRRFDSSEFIGCVRELLDEKERLPA